MFKPKLFFSYTDLPYNLEMVQHLTKPNTRNMGNEENQVRTGKNNGVFIGRRQPGLMRRIVF